MNNFKLSTTAEEDLIRIYHFGYENFGKSQADKYYSAFFDCFDKIALRPFSFESMDHIKSEYRRCVCGSDSIYFKVINDSVEIMTIIGKQDLKNVF